MGAIHEINMMVKRASSPYRTGIAVPLSIYGGKGRILWGGGKLDAGADGRPKASVGGVPVRKWEDLPSTKLMMAANDPKVNTPEVRRQKMMMYMPNAMSGRSGNVSAANRKNVSGYGRGTPVVGSSPSGLRSGPAPRSAPRIRRTRKLSLYSPYG